MNEQKKKYTIMKITLAYIFFFGDDQLRKLIMLQKLKSDTIRKGDNWLKKRLKIMILTRKFTINANNFKHQKSVQEDGKVLTDIVTRSM